MSIVAAVVAGACALVLASLALYQLTGIRDSLRRIADALESSLDPEDEDRRQQAQEALAAARYDRNVAHQEAWEARRPRTLDEEPDQPGIPDTEGTP